VSQPVSQAVIEATVFGLSDIGLVRKNNEDNFVIFNLSTGQECEPAVLYRSVLGSLGMLLVVADGMGGEASGEVASGMVAATVPQRLCQNLRSLENVSPTNFALLLRESVEYANQMIYEKAHGDESFRGMGTTTTAAAIFGPYLFVAQVGDSRAYVNRHGKMVQLTRDQTFLNYLAEIGAELPEDLENDNRKSILTQAVGTSEALDVKMTYTKLRDGDRLLLCSDGLYNMVKATGLDTVMEEGDGLEPSGYRLIEMARQQGGVDNITVVMAEVSGPGLPPADPQAPVEFREFKESEFSR
jgi:PPM family protein phosphatase